MPYYKRADLGIINIFCKNNAIFSQNFTRFLKQINIKFDREALYNMKPTRRTAYNITFFNNKSNISRYFKEDILNSLNAKLRVLKILAVPSYGVKFTKRKVSVFGVIVVPIFSHSDWIRTRITLNMAPYTNILFDQQ